MILDKKQINELSNKTKQNLLIVLYKVEDELLYKCDNVSETIDYLQKNIDTEIVFT